MELITDLHIHSHYSRATSPEMNISSLYRWGKMKGINIIGTGDFTHPLWFAELREKLIPAEPGLFVLNERHLKAEEEKLPTILKNKLTRFILTVEISNMYKRGGRGRRLHNLVIVPSFESASKINAALSRIGNLNADGRPILGLDSEELLKIVLDADPDNLFIPAHIWTPWFAMFGSRSGFDSVYEAFGENEKYIYAIETGLSSDPYMNWRIPDIKNRTIVSNSDAHSNPKLGREATLIDAEINYKSIIGAIKTNDERLVGTIEFFPEEGKYHYDGHANCNVSLPPSESKKINDICPVCKKPLVIGVMHRVDDLAKEPESYIPEKHKKVEYIVPLEEIIAEVFGVKVGGKRVRAEYEKVLAEFGDEFSILRHLPVDDVKKTGRLDLAFALQKMREKDIFIKPGYDGVFGVVSIFKPGERPSQNPQLSIF